jgi:hypothetical protein
MPEHARGAHMNEAASSQRAGEAIHRGSEVARLSALIEGPEPGLSLCAVSGPGGVGKSYFLEHVLRARDLAGQGWLELRADGSNPRNRGDFFGLVEGQLARRSLPPPAIPDRDYFPQTRKVAAVHRRLLDATAAELAARGAPEGTRQAALAILRGARFLNEHLPKTRELLDLASFDLDPASVNEAVDSAWALLTGLSALREWTRLPGPLLDLTGVGLENRVKRDVFRTTADALVADLSAALAAPRPKDFWKLTHPPVPGLGRLVLVLDDYEVLAPVLGDFLIGSLVPALATARFATLLIVSGRDDLEATHAGWAQHCRQYLKDQIRLAPFDLATALSLLAEAGVPEERRDRIFEATQGFPFLLGLAIEEAGSEGGGSALFLRKFFDRTTRWMTAREREWFTLVSYLDVVNEDTLARLFPADEVSRIQDWFEREASIRDPGAAHFRVRPLIREKVLRYLELRSPAKHRDLLERAKGAPS